MNTKLLLAASLLAFVGARPAVGLEMTANGSLEAQASWTALKTLVETANSRITVVSSTVNAIDGRLQGAEASLKGLSTHMDAVKSCGASGYVYNGSGCRKAVSNVSISAGSCFALSAQNVGPATESGTGPLNKYSCPSGSFMSSVVFEGAYVRSFECCTLNVSQ